MIPDNVMTAARRAVAHGLAVKLQQLSRCWIGIVDGEVVHLNDLPKAVEHRIERLAEASAGVGT